MKTNTKLLVIILTVSCLLPLIPTGLSATKTIVVPDQYATISDAVGNATMGDTIFVKQGTYEEHSLLVNKTLRIIGENKENTIILCTDEAGAWDYTFPFPPNKPNVLNIQANNVVISGFTIKSTTSQNTGTITKGIEAVGNGTLIHDNIVTDIKGANSVTGIDVTGSDNQVVGNLIQGANTGISLSGSNSTAVSNVIEDGQFQASGQYNLIMNNTIVKGRTYGMAVEGNYNLICNNTVNNQITGIFAGGVGNTLAFNIADHNELCGISISSPMDSIGNNSVYGNTVSYNRDGIFIGGGNNNTIYANNILCNHIGATVISYNAWMDHWAYNNTFYHNNLVSNTYTAADWNTRGVNLWDNGSEGNYWSGYTGTDTNRDGIGDTPYQLNMPYQVGNSDLTVYDPKKANPNEVKDHFPLTVPFNVTKYAGDLSGWTITQLPTATINETEEQNLQDPQQKIDQTTVIITTAITGVAIAVIAAFVYIKKKKEGTYSHTSY
jgi:nitrous oxidase accessory protein